MTIANCPTREELRDYAVGKLDDTAFAFVDEHIETCEPCFSVLTTIDEGQDTVLNRLRTLAGVKTYQNEPECQAGLVAARALVTAQIGGADLERTLAPDPVPQVSPDDLPQFAEYEILAQLGQGGMGTVYKARHKRLKRIVAIKLLPKERLADDRAVARFEREMEAVGAVDHPNVVRAMHAGEDDGRPYLVIEYVDGLDLTEIVTRLGALRIADACELVRQAAVGLQHAHTSGLVHRDIKPSNLMLTRDGTVKILDLGLALLQSPAPRGAEMTAAGSAMGTADYIAPEQVTDSHSVDIRADIYSLGCTLYKLIGGRAPFVGAKYKNEIGKMLAHVQKTPPPITLLRTDVSQELAAVVERMMAKEPAQRYTTPAEVAAALVPFAAGGDLARLTNEAVQMMEPVAATPAPSESTGKLSGSAHLDTGVSAIPAPKPLLAPAASRDSGRRRVWIALIAAAAAIPLIFAGWIIIRVRDDKGNVVSELKVPANQKVEIEQEGKPVVKFPAEEEPAPQTTVVRPALTTPMIAAQPAPAVKAGDPIHSFAHVSQPATLPGVRSWTIETRGHRGLVTDLAIQPTGQVLASAGEDRVLRLWDTRTGQLIRAFLGEGYAVAWSPDGKVLAAVGVNCLVLREAGTWRHLRTLQGGKSTGSGSAVAWSPQSSLISWIQQDGVYIVRPEPGETVHKLPIDGMQRNGRPYLAWSPNGETIITCGNLIGPGARVWDAKTGTLKRTVQGFGAMSWSHDGRLLAGLTDKFAELKFLDAASGEPVKSIENACTNAVWQPTITWSPDNRYVAVVCDGTIYDVATGKQTVDLPDCSSFAWAPDQSYVVTGYGSGDIQLWKMPSGELIQTLRGHVGGTMGVAWSPDGEFLAVSPGGATRIWKPRSDGFPRSLEESASNPFAVAWSPDGLAVAGGEYYLGLWDAATGRRTRVDNQGGYITYAWSPDGRRLAIAPTSGNLVVKISEATTGKLERTLEEVRGSGAWCLAWSPDGEVVAVGSASNGGSGIRIFDAATGKLLWTRRDKEAQVYAVSWSPDGKTLACAEEANVIIWDREGNKLDTLQAESWLQAVAWSPDGKSIIADGRKLGAALTPRTYRWDAESGRLLGTAELPEVIDGVTHFHQPARHGSVLAIGGGGLVRLWDTDAVRPLGVLALLAEDKSLVISPAGHYRGSPGVARELVYVVETDAGTELLTPSEFEQRYGWKNDPSRVGQADHSTKG